jgi:hypothetical protein
MKIERWMRATTAAIALGAVALGATACGDDSGTEATTSASTSATAARPLADRDQWCALVGVVDNQMAAVDRSDAEFTVRQARYDNIRYHVRRLEAGLELVDDDAREDVGALIGFADDVLTTVVEAADEPTAEQGVEAIYEGVAPEFGDSATSWISSTCGVDIG